MKYDFDRRVERRNTDSIKWKVEDNELPMWVADMDFETIPEVTEALKKRIDHPVYGYPALFGEWGTAYVKWWKERHGVYMEEEWLSFGLGVNFIISSVLKRLTKSGEKVVMLSPAYNAFYKMIEGNGRGVLESRLLYDEAEGTWAIDMEDLEKKLAESDASLFIMCNPHNPVGRIWSKKELESVGRLCIKHDVFMITDEIHCDITDPDKEYVPVLSLSEDIKARSIVTVSPTKTFNLAGIQTAAVVVPDKELRSRVREALSADDINQPNILSSQAAVAAFSYGGEWLDQLRAYIYENKLTVSRYLSDNIPKIRLTRSEATYLLWLDCRYYGVRGDELSKRIREGTGLFLSSGEMYGSGGEYFLRMNIACPRARLTDGLNRLKKAMEMICETDI